MEVNLTIKKILEIVDGVTSSVDLDFVVKNIKSLENADSQDLSVILERGEASVFDVISLEKIKNSKAAFLISNMADLPEKKYIIVKDAVTAFSKLIDYLTCQSFVNKKEKKIATTAIVDSQAVVSDGVEIGEGSIIKALAFIGSNCVIGSGVIIYPGVKILDNCIIGDGSIIHAGAVIGSDGFGYKVTQKGLQKIPQIGIVKVGRMVEIGANCTIDRASFDETVISDGVKIDNLVHIAHNVKIGAANAILAQTGIAGSVQTGIGCQIGGQVAIKNDTKIGNGVKIVSKSAVMNDIADGEVVCGMPAISFIKWKRLSVLQSKLPEFAKFASEVQAIIKSRKQSWIGKLWDRFFKKG